MALLIAQPASAISINDQVAAAAGGIANYYDAGNQFPNVVSLFNAAGSFCTGSLINSRTILTAAHCFAPNEAVSISFAPIAGPGVGITSFVRNPNFAGTNVAFPGNDVAVISLAQPITIISPVTIAGLVPAPGTVLLSAGYGANGTGTNCCNPIDNKRRNMTIEFGAFAPALFGAGPQPFLQAQFRDPLNPNSTIPNNNVNNVFNLTVPTSPLEGGTAGGDSGGPVFVQTAAGLVQIGELNGGFNPVNPNNPSQYGDISLWTPLALFLDWVAQNNPLRQVTAAAGNFNWSNPAAWIDSVPGVPGRVPDNTRGIVNFDANEAARYYDVSLSNPGTITLDMNPQIDTLSIAGGSSQLVIGAPHTLQVLLDTTLSAGTLTMLPGGILTTGTYTQTGGLLQFQLTPGGAGRITVVNTATLGGTLGVTVTPGLYGLLTQYTLLTAGAISGQFAQFISSPPRSAFLSLSGPFYDPTSVDVTVTRTPFGAAPGLSRNQGAVGNALEGAYSTTLTAPAATLYANLLMTGTPDALSQLSGEGTTAAQNAAFASGTMFGALLMDQGAFWRSGETADSNGITFRDAPLVFKGPKIPPPVYQPRTWRVWTGGFGGVQSFNGDASVGSADARTAVAGGAMGFDYQVDPTRLVGVAVGGSESHFSVPDRTTSGDVVGGHLGTYGVATWGALYAAGVVSYSRFDNRTTRTITGVGPTETATGSFASDLVGARLEIGRTYTLPGVNITPFAALQGSTLWERGFTETSTTGGLPGILGLTYQSQTVSSLPTFLGVQLDTRWAFANGTVWSPFVRAAWVHEFSPDRSITGSFVSVPGTLFMVDGARAWSNALKVNAGSRLALNQYASLFASFDGEFSNSGHSYAGRGGVRFSW